MRRRLLRAASMGAASLALAGALVVGVGVPANAAELEDLHSYQLTAPVGVLDSTPGDAFAFRDLARNYSDGRGALYPVSDPVDMSNLYGSGGSFQLVEDETGNRTFYQRGDAWPAANGKPAHVAQTEWDRCSGSSGAGLLAGFRNWLTGLAGGTDCNAIKSGWGAPMSDKHTPIGKVPVGGGSFPITATAGPVTATVGVPVWSMLDAGTSGGQVYGWLYPVSLSPVPEGATFQIRVANRWVSSSGAQVVPNASANSNVPVGGAVNPTAGSAQSLHPRERCGAATLCLHAGFNRADARVSTAVAAPGGAMPVLYEIATTYIKSPEFVNGAAKPMGTALPFSTVGSGGAKDPTGNTPQQEVKLMTSGTRADGSKWSCTSDGFIEKNGERIPLPCSPSKGDNVTGPLLVEVVPSSETGTYTPGSKPERGVAKPNPTGAYQDWKGENPECATTKRCVLDLERSGKSCFTDPAMCEKWEDEVKEPGHGYTCTYNAKDVGIAGCYVYAPTFNTEYREAGKGYEAPEGAPSGGSTTVPTNSGEMDSPLIGRGGECYPEGWAPANPVDWAMRPVQCALEWGFTPSESSVTGAAAALADAYAGSGVGALGDALGDLGGIFSQPSSCGGLPFEWSAYGVTVSERLFDACTSPWDGISNFTNNMIVALSSFLAFMAIWRYTAAVWGFAGPGGAIEQTQGATAMKVERASR